MQTFNQRIAEVRLAQDKKWDDTIGYYYPYSVTVSKPKPGEHVQELISIQEGFSEKRSD